MDPLRMFEIKLVCRGGWIVDATVTWIELESDVDVLQRPETWGRVPSYMICDQAVDRGDQD